MPNQVRQGQLRNRVRKDGTPEKEYASSVQLKEIYKKVMRWLCLNETKKYIIDHLIEDHNYSPDRAEFILKTARRQINDRYEAYKDAIAESNIKRLSLVIDEALEKGQLREATNAIDLLNKMGKCYSEAQNINITSTQPIIVKFDE